MLKKYCYYLRQILPLMRNSWLPSALLLGAVCFYMLFETLNESMQNILHSAFWIINLLSISLLIKFNRNRPLFFIIIITLAYSAVNYLKYTHGIIYYLTPAYLNLAFFTAAGLLFFYFLPNRPLFSADTLNFLIIIFAAVSLTESLSASQIKLDFSPLINFGCGLQIFGLSVFWIIVSVMLFFASLKDNILDTSLAYATVNVMIGFYFSAQPSALSLFFATASLTVLCGICRHLFFIARKDTATGLGNGRSFIVDAAKLPLKYGLGIICIDDYKHLLQAFRKGGINDIVLMISKKITETEPEAMLYRCTPDEFVILFPNAEKGTSFNRLDEIRRRIAASEFMLNKVKRPLKITVSCSIADKKRSDANVSDVFIRAHRILQKTYKFTQNITSQA